MRRNESGWLPCCSCHLLDDHLVVLVSQNIIPNNLAELVIKGTRGMSDPAQ
jgi:hypothetical protein